MTDNKKTKKRDEAQGKFLDIESRPRLHNTANSRVPRFSRRRSSEPAYLQNGMMPSGADIRSEVLAQPCHRCPRRMDGACEKGSRLAG
jgi:hypothetical protein